MNTGENIVEAYYRLCRGCFTMRDVKIDDAKGRQFDLLVVNLKEPIQQYHVESHVSLTNVRPLRGSDEQRWIEMLERKFFGAPKKTDRPKGDFLKGIQYQSQINSQYFALGLDPQKIQRVFCAWTFHDKNTKLISYLQSKNIDPLDFTKTVLPSLQESISTAHYEDDALRTVSLLKRWGAFKIN